MESVFLFADATMATMATLNLIAILILSKTVLTLTRDYFEQRGKGQEPLFRIDAHPDLAKGIDASIWNRNVDADRGD